MREILFRGKRVDNGKWIYGLPYERLGEIQSIRFQTDVSNIIGHTVCTVIPSTIGQYTGLIDKNSRKIFEGDIVKTKYGRLCNVVWFSSDCVQCWDLTPIEDKHPSADKHDLWRSKNLEVIGNIYDPQN